MKKKIYFLIILLYSCSRPNEKVKDKETEIQISNKKVIAFGDLGLSSSLLFPPSYFDNSSNSLLVFNDFRQSIDSLTFFKDTVIVNKGLEFAKEGPARIPNIESFFIIDSSYYLVSEKLISKFINKDTEVERIQLNKLNILEDYPMFNFRNFTNYDFNHFIQSYNEKKNILYIIAKDDYKKEIIFGEINLLAKSFKELPILFDTTLVNKHEILFEGDVYFSNSNLPYLLFINDKLIISYFYSSKIQVYDLNDISISNLNISTKNYPNEKVGPPNMSNIGNMKEVMEITKNWGMDVAFSQLKKIPNSSGYFRVIKNKSDVLKFNVYELFLETFDGNLNKISETNISIIQPDLSSFFFPTDDGIFFKAKNQPSEEELNYYILKF